VPRNHNELSFKCLRAGTLFGAVRLIPFGGRRQRERYASQDIAAIKPHLSVIGLGQTRLGSWPRGRVSSPADRADPAS